MSSSLQRNRSLRQSSTRPAERAPHARATAPRPLAPRQTAPAEPDRDDSPSRLPVKPPATRAAPTAGARGGSRPVSALVGRAASSSQRHNAVAPEPARREASSRCSPSSAPDRPSARTRPTSAGAQARRAPAHTRAKSTATGLHHPTPVLRPSLSDRPSTARPAVVARGGAASTPAKAVPHPPSTPPAAVASKPAPQPLPPRLRPAFSTLQQHYSPAKNLAPKPPTSTFLAPPSPSKLPANVAASAETSKLQAELLRLHLLHRDAAPTEAQWQASARDELGRRFAGLGEASRALADRQRAEMERGNILALRRWGSSGKGLDEKVQLLSDLLTGLWTLSEPGGRYGRAAKRFERWAVGVRDVEEARVSSSAPAVLPQPQGALFIDELDASWRDECEAMTRRLRDWGSQLQDIDDLAPATAADMDGDNDDDTGGRSTLERMLAGARCLARDMLAELRLMEDMAREALAREDEWVARMNRDDDGGEAPAAGAVWRTV